jgi:hypothetical protein
MDEDCTSLVSYIIAFYRIFWQLPGTGFGLCLAFGTIVLCVFRGMGMVVPVFARMRSDEQAGLAALNFKWPFF